MARKKPEAAPVTDAETIEAAPEAPAAQAQDADEDDGPDDEPPAPAAALDAIALDPGADWFAIAQPEGHRAAFAAVRDLEIRRTGDAFTSTETLRAGDVRVIGWRTGETLDARAV